MDVLKLKDKLLELVEELRIARITITENEERIKHLVSECHDKERILDEETSRQHALKAEHTESINSISRSYDCKIEHLEAEKNKLQLTSESWEKEMRTLKDDIRNLQLSKYNLEKTVREQAHRLHTQAQNKGSHSHQVSDMESKCREAIRKMNTCTEAIDTLTKEVTEANRLNKLLAFTNRHQDCQLKTLKAKMEEKQREMVELKTENAKKLDKRVSGKKEAELKIETLKKSNHHLVETNTAIKSQLEDVGKSKRLLQDQLKDAHNLAQRCLATSKEMTKKASEKEAEMTRLAEENGTLTEEKNKALEELHQISQEFRDKDDLKSKETTVLKGQIQHLQEENQASKRAKGNMEDLNATWASKNQALTNEIQKLEIELDRKVKEISDMKKHTPTSVTDGYQTDLVTVCDAGCSTSDMTLEEDDIVREAHIAAHSAAKQPPKELSTEEEQSLNNGDAELKIATLKERSATKNIKGTGEEVDAENRQDDEKESEAVHVAVHTVVPLDIHVEPCEFSVKDTQERNIFDIAEDGDENVGVGGTEAENVSSSNEPFSDVMDTVKLHVKPVWKQEKVCCDNQVVNGTSVKENVNQKASGLNSDKSFQEGSNVQENDITEDRHELCKDITSAIEDCKPPSEPSTIANTKLEGCQNKAEELSDIPISKLARYVNSIFSKNATTRPSKGDALMEVDRNSLTLSQNSNGDSNKRQTEVKHEHKEIPFADQETSCDVFDVESQKCETVTCTTEDIAKSTSPNSDTAKTLLLLPQMPPSNSNTCQPIKVPGKHAAMEDQHDTELRLNKEGTNDITLTEKVQDSDDDDVIIPATFLPDTITKTVPIYKARISEDTPQISVSNSHLIKDGVRIEPDEKSLNPKQTSCSAVNVAANLDAQGSSIINITSSLERWKTFPNLAHSAFSTQASRRIPALLTSPSQRKATGNPKENQNISSNISHVGNYSLSQDSVSSREIKRRGLNDTDLASGGCIMSGILRKRSVDTKVMVSPSKSSIFEEHLPPTKVRATAPPMVSPFQTAQQLHKSLLGFSRSMPTPSLPAVASEPSSKGFQGEISSSTKPTADFGQGDDHHAGTPKTGIPDRNPLAHDPLSTSAATVGPTRLRETGGGDADGEVSLFSDDDDDGDMKRGVASQIDRIQNFLQRDRLRRGRNDDLV